MAVNTFEKRLRLLPSNWKGSNPTQPSLLWDLVATIVMKITMMLNTLETKRFLISPVMQSQKSAMAVISTYSVECEQAQVGSSGFVRDRTHQASYG